MFIFLRIKNIKENSMEVSGVLNESIIIDSKSSTDWKWIKQEITISSKENNSNTLKLKAISGSLSIDKFIVSSSETLPNLENY